MFYKVTRLDGSSFHTDRVRYEVGKRVRPEPHDGTRQLCGPGLLHASPSAPEAARYGRWPYRLFAVDGKPYATQPDKAGFTQLTVVAELDVAECFGSNGQRVLAMIRQAEQLTPGQAKRLVAARVAAGDAAWDAARDAARDAAWVAAWVAAGDVARNAARDAARDAAREAAGDVAGDAAWALVVEDLIGQHGFTQDHFDILVGLWRDVVGLPE